MATPKAKTAAAPKATKLSTELKKKLESVGITASTEEEARKVMTDFLATQELEGLDSESTDDLIEMYESFYEPTAETEDEAEAEDEADEDEAEEIDLDSMNRKELEAFIEEQGLTVEFTKKTKDKELRELIEAAMTEGEDDAEDEDEAEEEVADEDEAVDLEAMTRKELEAFIKEQELDVAFTKKTKDAELRELIEEAMGAEEELDLDSMDRAELEAFIEEQELDIKVTKKMKDEQIRELIAEAMGAEGEDEAEAEEETEEEAEEEAEEESGEQYTKKELEAMELDELKAVVDSWELAHPKVKTKPNYVKLILSQYEEEEPEVVVKSDKKAADKKASTGGSKATRSSNTVKFLTANKDHAKLLLVLENHITEYAKKAYPKFKIRHHHITQGLSVYIGLNNSEKVLISYCHCRLIDNVLVGNLDLNACKGDEEVKASKINDLGKGFKNFSTNLLFIPAISAADCVKVLTPNVLKYMFDNLSSSDKALGVNKDKLKEKAEATTAKAVPAPAKKAAAPVVAPAKKKVVILKKK